MAETVRHGRESLESIRDVWLHEGFKHGLEQGLYHAAHSSAGRWLLDRVSGNAPVGVDMTTNIGATGLQGPVGLAPGWDKTGKSIAAWQMLGAQHTTVGGVTEYPQPGNAMPRLRTFNDRVGDHGTKVSLNSYGFYSPGSQIVSSNIAAQRASGPIEIPVFGQVTANKEFYAEDERHKLPDHIARTALSLLQHVDGFSFGLTSPNTIGMRDAQALEVLMGIITRTIQVTGNETDEHKEYIFKGDGDGGVDRLDMYVELIRAVRAATGAVLNIELINTTALAEIKAKYGAEHLPGGLAGDDAQYHQLAVDSVAYVYDAVGTEASIIGCGGVKDGSTAMDLVTAGASAISINTGVRARFPAVMKAVEFELAELVPYGKTLRECIGTNTTRGALYPRT